MAEECRPTGHSRDEAFATCFGGGQQSQIMNAVRGLPNESQMAEPNHPRIASLVHMET